MNNKTIENEHISIMKKSIIVAFCSVLVSGPAMAQDNFWQQVTRTWDDLAQSELVQTAAKQAAAAWDEVRNSELVRDPSVFPVSYTHLTLPTN